MDTIAVKRTLNANDMTVTLTYEMPAEAAKKLEEILLDSGYEVEPCTPEDNSIGYIKKPQADVLQDLPSVPGSSTTLIGTGCSCRDLTAEKENYTTEDINNRYFPDTDPTASVEDNETIYTEEMFAPTQILPTYEEDNNTIFGIFKDVSSMELNMIPYNDLTRQNIVLSMIDEFLPKETAERLMVFPSASYVLRFIQPDSIFTGLTLKGRILSKIPDANKPFIFYAGHSAEHDAFSYNISYCGIMDVLADHREDRLANGLMDNSPLLPYKYKTKTEDISFMLETILNTYGDLYVYDNNISIEDAINLYNRLGEQHVLHNNGRTIFEAFLERNKDFKEVLVNVDQSIYTGYRKSNVLFVPDCVMNYVRLYLFDITDAIEEESVVNPEDYGYEVMDIEFGDTILDEITYLICSTYREMFTRYCLPTTEEDSEEGHFDLDV